MNSAVASEVQRRGNPFARTGWGPGDIKTFMKYQFALSAAGMLKPEDLGGFAYRLPGKRDHGEPAQQPKEVIHWMETGELKPPEDRKRKNAPGVSERGKARLSSCEAWTWADG